MNKKIVTLAMAAVFALSTVSFGFAAKLQCTVDSVEGDSVTMACKEANQLKAGDEVKVSAKRKLNLDGGC